MKHLFFALVIALLSTPAATTAWSQQTEQTGPTEQETKGFIVETMGKCKDTTEVKFEGSNLHLSLSNKFGHNRYRRIIAPLQKLETVSAALGHGGERLVFLCKGIEGDCILGESNDGGKVRDSTAHMRACSHETHEVLAKAFNHLIGIYDAKRPKPLFE